MIKVSSTVKFNQAKLKQLSAAAVTALEQTADALYTEVVQAQVIPRDTGALQNDYTFVDTSQSGQGVVSIVSTAPYARRLYFHPEFNFSTDENPNARGEWYDEWINGQKRQSVIDTYEEIYRRLTRV